MLKPLLVNDYYLDLPEAEGLFRITPRNIKKNFSVVKINGKEYVDYRLLVNFVRKFIEKGSFYLHSIYSYKHKGNIKDRNGLNSLGVIWEKLKKYNVSYECIIDFIENESIDVKINPFNAGISAIFLPEDIIIQYIVNNKSLHRGTNI